MYLSTQCGPRIDKHIYPSKIADSVSQMNIPELENGSPHIETSGQGGMLQTGGLKLCVGYETIY